MQVIYIHLKVRLESNKNDWEVSATERYIRTKFGYKVLSEMAQGVI